MQALARPFPASHSKKQRAGVTSPPNCLAMQCVDPRGKRAPAAEGSAIPSATLGHDSAPTSTAHQTQPRRAVTATQAWATNPGGLTTSAHGSRAEGCIGPPTASVKSAFPASLIRANRPCHEAPEK